MDYPIVYRRRKLNKVERNYSTTEREALGMVFALQKYQHYLLENPFIFYTDHQALKYLVNKSLHHGIIFRWLLIFQEFEFKVIVRLGKLNVGPDHLSWINRGEEPIGMEDDLPDAYLFCVPVCTFWECRLTPFYIGIHLWDCMVQLSWLRFVSSSYSCLLVLVHLLKTEIFPLILSGLLLF